MSKSVRKIVKKVNNYLAKIEPAPIFILGNEKSGTTIIAASLAELTSQEVTLDIPTIWDPVQTQLHSGAIPFFDFVNANKDDFSKKIIKEPVLSFEYQHLREHFPEAQFVLVIRDPRDNIRSILNRLQLKGDQEKITNTDKKNLGELWTTWHTVLDVSWLGLGNYPYIEAMARRWNYLIDVYQDQLTDIKLIRYEDFMQDKVGAIQKLATQLNQQRRKSIDEFVDTQFQSKGDNSQTHEQYYGSKNLQIINAICHSRMIKMGYDVG